MNRYRIKTHGSEFCNTCVRVTSDFVRMTGRAVSDADSATLLVDMCAQSRLLDEINIDRCNGIERFDVKAGRRMASWTDADERNAEEAENTARERALKDIAALFGNVEHRVEFNGDPRGSAIRVHFMRYTLYV